MKLSKNFTLKELTKSSTAVRHGIDNNPNKEQMINLVVLTNCVLQPIRNAHVTPITSFLFDNSGESEESMVPPHGWRTQRETLGFW